MGVCTILDGDSVVSLIFKLYYTGYPEGPLEYSFKMFVLLFFIF